LTWPDIDWRKGRLRIDKVLVRGRARAGEGTGIRGWFHKEPKTASSRRTIDIPAALLARLREHQAAQVDDQASAGDRYQKEHLVFADRLGRPAPTLEFLGKCFKRVLSEAGLPGPMRLYDLRHTCATLLLKAGVNVKVVSERLGHASVKITLDTYAEVLPSMQAQASAHLESMLYSQEA
jgi:integrase